MVCKICGKEFVEDWRKSESWWKKKHQLEFCSFECAHARSHSTESREKARETARHNAVEKGLTIREYFETCQACGREKERSESPLCINCYKEKKRLRGPEHIAELLLQGVNIGDKCSDKRTLRKALIKIQGYKCVECGIGETYNSKLITLHIDHKDGDSTNYTLENLRFLCPNCHSQTSNFGAKNKGKSTRDWYVFSKRTLTSHKCNTPA